MRLAGVRKVFNTWAEVTHEIAEAKAKLHAAAMSMRFAGARKAFNAWSETAREAAEAKAKLRAVAMSMRLTGAKKAFNHWSETASETALSNRIAQLADAVSPGEGGGAALSFAAMAHYREKLHRNAEVIDNRVRAAEAEAARALEARQTAKRDQTAVEKLMARADAEAALRAIRALQEAPPPRPRRG